MTARALATIAFAASTPAMAQLFFANDFNPTLYQLSTVNGAATPIGASGVIPSTGFSAGLCETALPTEMLGSIPDFGLNYIQTDGSGATFATSIIAEALAYEPGSGVFYGARQGQFFSLDPTNSTFINLPAAPGNADIQGLAARNGLIYGLVGFFGPGPGNLWAYDPTASSWSFVGASGVPFETPGLAYNPDDDFFYAKGSQNSNLYRLSPVNGVATLVGDTGLFGGGGLAYVVVPGPGALGVLALGGIAAARRRR